MRQVGARAVLPAGAPDALVRAGEPGQRGGGAAREQVRDALDQRGDAVRGVEVRAEQRDHAVDVDQEQRALSLQPWPSSLASSSTLATRPGSSHIGTWPQPVRIVWCARGSTRRARGAWRDVSSSRSCSAHATVAGQTGTAGGRLPTSGSVGRKPGRAGGAVVHLRGGVARHAPRPPDDLAHQQRAADRAAVGELGDRVERAGHRVGGPQAAALEAALAAPWRGRRARARRRCGRRRGRPAPARSPRRASCRRRAGGRAPGRRSAPARRPRAPGSSACRPAARTRRSRGGPRRSPRAPARGTAAPAPTRGSSVRSRGAGPAAAPSRCDGGRARGGSLAADRVHCANRRTALAGLDDAEPSRPPRGPRRPSLGGLRWAGRRGALGPHLRARGPDPLAERRRAAADHRDAAHGPGPPARVRRPPRPPRARRARPRHRLRARDDARGAGRRRGGARLPAVRGALRAAVHRADREGVHPPRQRAVRAAPAGARRARAAGADRALRAGARRAWPPRSRR